MIYLDFRNYPFNTEYEIKIPPNSILMEDELETSFPIQLKVLDMEIRDDIV